MQKKLTPSILPALLTCKDYEVADTTDARNVALQEALNNGKAQHAYLKSLIDGAEDADLPLTTSELTYIKRAYRKILSFIREHAPKATVQSEVELITWRMRGIADILAWDATRRTLIVIDYKSHDTQKNFTSQVYWYASAWMQEYNLTPEAIYIGIIFGDSGRFDIHRAEVPTIEAFVTDVITKLENQQTCNASPWCASCEKRGACTVAADTIKAFKQVKVEKHLDHLAERLDESIEVEKRIKEMKTYAKECLEDGQDIIAEDHTYGFKLQETTNYGIDFERAFTFFASTHNDELIEAFLEGITIPKTTVDLLLQKVENIDTIGGRGKVLKSLLNTGRPVKRLKRITL